MQPLARSGFDDLAFQAAPNHPRWPAVFDSVQPPRGLGCGTNVGT